MQLRASPARREYKEKVRARKSQIGTTTKKSLLKKGKSLLNLYWWTAWTFTTSCRTGHRITKTFFSAWTEKVLSES
jgi:hypothetical protein